MKRNFKLTIEYDGTGYHGWQRQKGDRSIQGEIEAALAVMTRETISVYGSGRTDAGVHALGQTAHFHCDTALTAEAFQKGLNALLADDIVITACETVSEDFHARYSAESKTYAYSILNRPLPAAIGRQYVWHIRKPLDLDAMKAAAACLIGTLDFKAFEGAGSPRSSTVRTVLRADFYNCPDDRLRFEIQADGFLRFMVRNIVGTLVSVGHGKIAPGAFLHLLASRDRHQAGPTAPACGLTLVTVEYA